LSSAPVTLDPRFATDATSARINRLLYESLVDFNEASEPIPELASWKLISPDHYRFTLKDDRSFHDGRKLTSQDVKETYEFILDPANASPHRGALTLIDHIETPDEMTVDFFLSRADPLFPGYLVIGILPSTLIDEQHPFNRQPVGTGPFVFMDWEDEGHLRIRRASDQQIIEFLKVKDPTVRTLKLMRGEIDMMQSNLPPELINFLRARDDTNVMKREGSNYSYIGFNLQDQLTSRLEIRQAIAYALDRDAIIQYVLGGAARPATSLLPPDHWAGHPNLPQYTYNPSKATQLLDSVNNAADKTIELSYKTSNDPLRIRLATIIQQQLSDIGFEVSLRSYDWGTFYGDIKAGNFQMYSLAWVGIKTPDIYRYVFHSEAVPPNGANRGRYANPSVDQLIEQAEKGQNRDDMLASYKELQEKVHAELPYIPLWYEDHVFISRKNVQGYKLSADGNYDGLMYVKRQR
jgi:peptide/nickel transport system substrate-binding protein